MEAVLQVQNQLALCRTAVQNNQTDAVPLNTIRQLTEAQYDALAAESPSAVNPNTMYFIVGP